MATRGLAFAGFHFGDLALMQDHAPDQLHVKVTLPKRSLCGLTNRGKGFRQQIVWRFPVPQPFLEGRGKRQKLQSDFFSNSGSSALIRPTIGCLALIFRSFTEPNNPVKTFKGR